MKLIALILALAPFAALADVHYALEPDPGAGAIHVRIHLDQAGPNSVFRIPAWCPGFYTLKAYEEKISGVRAVDSAGKAIAFDKPDARSWQVHNKAGSVTFSYTVLGDDGGLGFFGVNVRSHTAFINGPAAFMYADGHKDERATLAIRNPKDWDTAIALDQNEKGLYVAGGYDELLDSPIRLGKFERRKFVVEGIPFEAVFSSINQKYNPDLDAEVKTLQQVSVPAIRMFGKPTPFKRYIYFVNLAVGDFSGGLEHRSCTVLAMPNMRDLDLATLASHEFFHAWNVKQMRPQVLGPFDYTVPCRTHNLWFAEGVTDYYSDLNAYRSGLFDRRWYFRSLANNIAELQRSNTRKELSLEQVCWQTWEHSGFDVGDLSYYTKGLVVGATLDAAIREATDGKKSLDDVMRLMMSRYRLPQPGYPEDGILQTVNEVAKKDLTALYDVLVRSTDEVPYDRWAAIGLRVLPPKKDAPTLGFMLEGSKVVAVDDGGALELDDEVISVDDAPFAPGAFASRKESYAVKVKRAGAETTVTVKSFMKTPTRWTVEPDPFATAIQARRLEQFLQR